MNIILLLTVIMAVTVASLPSNKIEISGTTTAMIYLSKFGYMPPTALNPESGALISEDAVRSSILRFQEFAGLNQTGFLDEETVMWMNMPRCGVKDTVGHGSNARRRKRYALQGSRWKVRNLTYKISKYPDGLTRSEVDDEIDRAFQVWADVSTLTFTKASSGKIHIDVRFEKGEHGDGDPFDGPGGTLAHAYFPIYGGDAHFDDTETWTIDSYRGTNLFQVAAHEFGHSLGLSHSDVRSSLMAPFYRGYERNFKLDQDDITAIQSLYGKKEDPTAVTPVKPTSPRPAVDNSNPLCQDSSFDTIVTMSNSETYVFKGSQYYLLTDDAIAPGYPKSISADFDGLPDDLDAAFTWNNGKTYFFKGSLYWRFTDLIMDSGYPKQISKGFAGIPANIDTAFVWSGNGKIYFTKGTQYWKFDPTSRPPISESYPRDSALWEGLPYNMNGALQYTNGYTYFFKNGEYYRFSDRAFKVDETDPPFPRSTGQWWFGCSASASQRISPNARAGEASQPNDMDVGGEDKFDAGGAGDDDRFLVSTRFAGGHSDTRDQKYHSNGYHGNSYHGQHGDGYHGNGYYGDHKSKGYTSMDSGSGHLEPASIIRMMTAFLLPVVAQLCLL